MSVSVRRDLVILACAISAGIHGALAPAHFSEGAPAGVSFVAAATLLGGIAVALTRRPGAALLHVGAALTFGGLIASYALAVTTGLPALHPEPERIDGLALVTKAIELVGALAAVSLLQPTPNYTRKEHRHEHDPGRTAHPALPRCARCLLQRARRSRRLERSRGDGARQRL